MGDCPVVGAKNFDAFHELIAWEEICRIGSGGLAWGICEGIQIGVPPLLNFGTPEMRDIATQRVACSPNSASETAKNVWRGVGTTVL